VLENEARALNPGFIARMSRGRGRVRAKLAMSLDGRTAMASGESQWITSAAARQDVQRLRAGSCAVLTGIGTVLSDNCALTVRPAELALPPEEADLASLRQPLRVVLDSRLQTPSDARVLAGDGPTYLCHSAAVSASTALRATGASFLALPQGEGGLAFAPLFSFLAEQQCNEILVESGPRLAGALLQAGYLDELIVYMAPALLGSRARPLLQLPLDAMADKVPLTFVDVRTVGKDLRFTAIPGHPEPDGQAH
jgi:diaminohydroxyphosphoribosylaminopyrimidine deaminase/5-amino-6-(5-phosphoribosylamino)uracil reductase